jgi:hypothetical protein
MRISARQLNAEHRLRKSVWHRDRWLVRTLRRLGVIW